MNIPSSGMVDHSGPNLDKPSDYRLYRRLDSLPPECAVPDHVEQIVGQTSDEKPRLIRCKPPATCLVPSEGVLPFFYPVFNLTPTVVCGNYFVRFKLGVGHNKSDAREEFAGVPFNLADNPPRLIPFLRLVMKLDHPYPNAALWRTTCGPLGVRQDDLPQAVVDRKQNF